MVSAIVGVILMLACEVVFGAYVFIEFTENGDKEFAVSYAEVAEKCHCEPPQNEDGSPCLPVTTLDSILPVAWKCKLKHSLMYGEAPSLT